jgi:hypothetical protein
MTLIINSLSRLLIWSMARPMKAPVSSVVPAVESAA